MIKIAKENSAINHYDWVDYAKGIGIILVVYGHVARGVFNAGLIDNDNVFRLVDSIIYSFHMPLFFFLSGLFFIGSLTKRGEGEFIISKVYSIMYPYVIWSLIQGGVEYSLSDVTNFHITAEDIYSLWWQPHDQFWFLYALFLVFMINTLIYRFTSDVFVLFVISILMYVFKDFLHSPWGIMNAIYQYSIYFCAGILFSKYMGFVIKSTYYWLACTVFLFILSQWSVHGYLNMIHLYNKDLLLLAVAFIGIFAAVMLSTFLSKHDFSLVKYIGSYSLEIYLIHVLFGSGFRIVMQKIFAIESSAFHLIFGTLVGIFISIFFVWCIRRLGAKFLFTMPKRDAYSASK